MWYEYLIIFAGLALAAGYVLWLFFRSFNAKGNCCGSGCASKPAGSENDRRLRATPLVKLNTPRPENDSSK